jgi:hypothetical protein
MRAAPVGTHPSQPRPLTPSKKVNFVLPAVSGALVPAAANGADPLVGVEPSSVAAVQMGARAPALGKRAAPAPEVAPLGIDDSPVTSTVGDSESVRSGGSAAERSEKRRRSKRPERVPQTSTPRPASRGSETLIDRPPSRSSHHTPRTRHVRRPGSRHTIESERSRRTASAGYKPPPKVDLDSTTADNQVKKIKTGVSLPPGCVLRKVDGFGEAVRARKISANFDLTAVVTHDARLWTFGRAATDDANIYFPEAIDGAGTVRSVAAGRAGRTFALDADGQPLLCVVRHHEKAMHRGGKRPWQGSGADLESDERLLDRLERTAQEQRLACVPIPLFNRRPVRMASAGTHHVVLLTWSGQIWSFGKGAHGELGLGRDGLGKIVSLATEPTMVTVDIPLGDGVDGDGGSDDQPVPFDGDGGTTPASRAALRSREDSYQSRPWSVGGATARHTFANPNADPLGTGGRLGRRSAGHGRPGSALALGVRDARPGSPKARSRGAAARPGSALSLASDDGVFRPTLRVGVAFPEGLSPGTLLLTAGKLSPRAESERERAASAICGGETGREPMDAGAAASAAVDDQNRAAGTAEAKEGAPAAVKTLAPIVFPSSSARDADRRPSELILLGQSNEVYRPGTAAADPTDAVVRLDTDAGAVTGDEGEGFVVVRDAAAQAADAAATAAAEVEAREHAAERARAVADEAAADEVGARTGGVEADALDGAGGATPAADAAAAATADAAAADASDAAAERTETVTNVPASRLGSAASRLRPSFGRASTAPTNAGGSSASLARRSSVFGSLVNKFGGKQGAAAASSAASSRGSDRGAPRSTVSLRRSAASVSTKGGGSADGDAGPTRRELPVSPTVGHTRHATIIFISAGSHHTAALTDGGDVYTWGRGHTKAQGNPLGHGNLKDAPVPKRVQSLRHHTIVHVSAGDRHSLAVSEAGWTFSWGDGESGQLGHGDLRSLTKPKYIEALRHLAYRKMRLPKRLWQKRVRVGGGGGGMNEMVPSYAPPDEKVPDEMLPSNVPRTSSRAGKRLLKLGRTLTSAGTVGTAGTRASGGSVSASASVGGEPLRLGDALSAAGAAAAAEEDAAGEGGSSSTLVTAAASSSRALGSVSSKVPASFGASMKGGLTKLWGKAIGHPVPEEEEDVPPETDEERWTRLQTLDNKLWRPPTAQLGDVPHALSASLRQKMEHD